MSESQGYKLGMKMGLSDKRALFDAVREHGSKREVELLMGSGPANTAFRAGLKSAAFALSKAERRPAARKKTTRQRLTTAKRPAAKRKASSRKSSRPKYFSEKQVLAWFDKIPRKIGRYQPYDSKAGWTTEEDMTSEERKDLAVWYASAGPDQAFGVDIPDSADVWVLSQEYRDSPFVLSANDGSGQQFSGTFAQMKKKLAAISRRKRKNPSRAELVREYQREMIRLGKEAGFEVVPDGSHLGRMESKFDFYSDALPGGRAYEGSIVVKGTKRTAARPQLAVDFGSGSKGRLIYDPKSRSDISRLVRMKVARPPVAGVIEIAQALALGDSIRSIQNTFLDYGESELMRRGRMAASRRMRDRIERSRDAPSSEVKPTSEVKPKKSVWQKFLGLMKGKGYSQDELQVIYAELKEKYPRKSDYARILAKARTIKAKPEMESENRGPYRGWDTRFRLKQVKRKNPREVITYFIKPRRFTSPEAAADKLETMLRRMNYIDALDIEEIEDGIYVLTIVGPRSFFTEDGELIAGFAPEKEEMERLITYHIGPIQREA